MKLYDFELSGNCWKVRLALSLWGLPYDTQLVDLAGGENRGEAFLALNPRGQVPTLDDDGLILADSQAILVHLALRHQPDWFAPPAEVVSWLSLAANEIANGPAALRLNRLFGAKRDEAFARELALKVFGLLEKRLSAHPWLVGDSPTIADVACYPYLKLAPDGGFDPSPYPAVTAWFHRFEALPGYCPIARVRVS